MKVDHRPHVRDLASTLAAPPSPADSPPPLPWSHQTAGIEDLLQLVRDVSPTTGGKRASGARDVLIYLARFPAEEWANRWQLFETDTAGRRWMNVVLPQGTDWEHQKLASGLAALIVLDLVRPSYGWMYGRKLRLSDVGAWRDPDDTAALRRAVEADGMTPPVVMEVLYTTSQLQAHTGKRVRQLGAQDLIDYPDGLDPHTQYRRGGLSTLWRVLHGLSWIQHESHILPLRNRRRGQRSCEEMVHDYGVSGPQGHLLVEYLKHRTADLDYPTRKQLARNLVKLFWKDMLDHHPDLDSFAITRAQADEWKNRIRSKPDGTPRRDHYDILFAVRGFYLDVAQWALQDAYWAPWVAPSPIYQTDLKGHAKARRQRTARQQQRTRELAPVLPRLVAQAEQDKRDTAAILATTRQAGPGATVEFNAAQWRVCQASPQSPLRLRRDGHERNLNEEEDNAFWAWAIIETLRHSGIRNEELLELTHLAIQPYTVPATGETLPLLHIVPSKTDEERLLVASPELVHVLAEVLKRIRSNAPDVPLSQRWDGHEKVLGQPLPHLFVRRVGADYRVFSPHTVANHLKRVATRGNITAAGRPIHFTPHDLRRIFATDALASGLPPHIVQVLMGHKSITTTQGYAAIYPQDVIRHHRTFIAQRRQQRPSEEYREPTAAEWEEFEAHFVQRKVSLGSCGRAYGTNCHHEHACVRCALLRPDPTQIQRLEEIADNLRDRIDEATDQGWLGEVEGLQISLTGAKHKLQQMRHQIERVDEPVTLGLPRMRGSEGTTPGPRTEVVR